MKVCPKCGAVYPDSFVYCDQDGTALRVRNRKRAWLVGAAIAAVAIAGAAVALNAYFVSHIAAEVTSVSVQATAAEGLSPLDRLVMLVNVRARSTSFLSPVLRNANFDCSGGGANIADLSWPSEGEQPVTIPSQGSADLAFRLHLHTPEGHLADIAQPSLNAVCRGDVHLYAWGIPMVRTLRFEQALW